MGTVDDDEDRLRPPPARRRRLVRANDSRYPRRRGLQVRSRIRTALHSNINWGAIADAISKHIDDYYEIEIDLSGADSDLQSEWPGRGCPCMNNNKVRSFLQCDEGNNKYLEFVRVTHGTNWEAEMEKCAKKEGKTLDEKKEEFA